MRIRVTFYSQKTAVIIPVNNRDLFTGIVYNILSKSSIDYSSFLHDHGYHEVNKPARKFKMFDLTPI